ncbi:hypothetical protein QYE76_022662 [Lolium multiflorum]|uniref:Retrotransposon gag domain-containing protein n=1 Tax=Lolium multiflorum TaxID=4521 RepID=A0AAD8R919_LOLMU|nr:hypothetical protein QYE76_022662 [Lolium multiflorum]
MAEEQITYEDLPPDHKKKYDELKAIVEAELIGSFEKTRSHGIRFKGFTPQGVLDGLDLSLPSDERTRALRQEINYVVAHSLHRHSESLVNSLERVAFRVIQEIMERRYSPSGPALGTHQGEVQLHTRPPLPYSMAAPQQQGSPAYVVYKVGGDPGDYQFLYEPPKEIPHGYVCTFVPDCNNWTQAIQAPTGGIAGAGAIVPAGGTTAAAGGLGAEAEKQAWLAKYATAPVQESSAATTSTADQISAVLRDQFGILPKKKVIGYSKPYPNEFDLIPLPPKYRLPDFNKFSGSEGSSSIEHVSRYLAQLGMVSASDELRVRFFSQSLTGPAFGWYTSLQPNSIRSWKQLEEQFHTNIIRSYEVVLPKHRSAEEENGVEYIQRFRTVKNRCYSVHLTEKEAVELAVAGLAASFKDLTFQVEYNSGAPGHRLTLYEQRHPELYQDKFKRAITLVNADEDEDSAEDQEVAVAEWTRTPVPVSCKWVNPPGPPRGSDFDVSKTEQIFDLLLKEKQLKLPEGHKIPTAQEMNKRPYCKWHHTFTHATNDCKVLRAQIQMAIESGRLTFGQFAMKVDMRPFPDVNMVDLSHSIREPGFSFDVNMAGFVIRHGKDKAESSHSRGKDKEEVVPRDRPQDDDRRYLTEEEVRSIRYQRPLSVHLLNKYEQQYDRRRRYDEDGGKYRRSMRKREEPIALKRKLLGDTLPRLLLLALPYLGAAAALVVIAAVGATPGRLVVAAVAAAGRTFVVLVFFISVVVIAVEVAEIPGPGAVALGRRLVGGAIVLLLSTSSEEVTPSQGRSSSSLSAAPLTRLRRTLSPSVRDWSSSDQMEKSWLGSSPASMARRMLAAWASSGFHSGVGSRKGEDCVERPDEEEEEDILAKEGFWKC